MENFEGGKLIDFIMDSIPHRYPFLLVDRVTRYDDTTIEGFKNLTFNENFFQGHFPNVPIMPGVLQVEGLAQIGAVFHRMLHGNDPNKLIVFAGIDKVKFRRQVVPGDRLDYKVSIIKDKKIFFKFHGQATVDGQLACEAEMTASVVKKDEAGK